MALEILPQGGGFHHQRVPMDGRKSSAVLGQLKSRRRKEEIGQQVVDMFVWVRAELVRIRAACDDQDAIARKPRCRRPSSSIDSSFRRPEWMLRCFSAGVCPVFSRLLLSELGDRT